MTASVAQHAGLTLDRWARFTWDQRILSIAADANRALRSLEESREASAASGYERMLNMLELTLALADTPGRRRETARLREHVAELFWTLAETAQPERVRRHRSMMRALLGLSRDGVAQISALGL